MTDYYSILSRAVSSLDRNTTQARATLFQRARGMLIDKIENDRERWTDEAAWKEIANFDTAAKRVESEFARRTANDSTGRYRRHSPAGRTDHLPARPHAVSSDQSKRGIGRIAAWSAAALCAVLFIGLAIYAFNGSSSTSTKAPGATVATAPQAGGTASRSTLDDNDLPPGVDGGSTNAGLPYYLRRQAVYYRSIYSDGMIVVDRSQRYLYLVQPQTRAWRYGIGVGGECDLSPGLYRIKSKSSQWPEWSPSPALLKRGSYPSRVAGGPGNPLGAYALYFESSIPGIHGTNAPQSIGQTPTLGCFRLINDDVVDLEKRVAIGTGVVIIN